MAYAPTSVLTCELIDSEAKLITIASALCAAQVGGSLSSAESRLAGTAGKADVALVKSIQREILAGGDPLGDAFCRLRSPLTRRGQGQFFTPPEIVDPMVEWTLKHEPTRIIDCGAGSGRYAMRLARAGYAGQVIAVDLDPVATMLVRANLAVLKPVFAFTVKNQDFLTTQITSVDGVTAFIGNPPYVRHHDLSQSTKMRAKRIASHLGVRVSGIAGLHTLFTLRIAEQSRPGDVGCLVTSSEWLDTKYGSVVRELLAGRLGLERADLIDPKSVVFDDAMASGLIYSWVAGSAATPRFRRVSNRSMLRVLTDGKATPRAELAAERWSPLFDKWKTTRAETVRLGDIARVHRGSATGSNEFFVMTLEQARERGIDQWGVPCLTRAAQVIQADGAIDPELVTRIILNLPAVLPPEDTAIAAYIAYGEKTGYHERYLCAHRNPWWRLGLKPAADIVATYMARQPPLFAVNAPGVRTTNTVHGIYLKDPVAAQSVKHALVGWLNLHRSEFSGRTYHGGLTKFEPSEMENIRVEMS